MKNQALFSSKDKSTKLKSCLLQFLFGALRVNTVEVQSLRIKNKKKNNNKKMPRQTVHTQSNETL